MAVTFTFFWMFWAAAVALALFFILPKYMQEDIKNKVKNFHN